MDMLLGLAVMLSPPAYLVLQVVMPMTASTSGERLAALLPLLLSVPIALWCLYALGQESNLWPLPFIFFSPFGAGYLVVALLVRASLRRA